jgi:Ribosomal protein L11 methylase
MLRTEESGCDAFGIDFSSEAISIAQKAYPGLRNRFFVENLYNLDTVMSGEFDGIVANAVLVHLLDRNDMPDILEKICGRLRKNGLCFIRVIKKGNLMEELDNHLFGGLRWFVYYSKEELKTLAENAGFNVEEIDERSHVQHPDVYWVSLLLRKK